MSIVSKSWVYTLNNYTENDEKIIQAWEHTYSAYGRETSESGTPHLQGFITFKRAYRLSALKKLMPRAHWEKACTSDAANYCFKEGDFWLSDQRRKRGRGGSKLEDLTEFITGGGSLDDAWKQFPDTMVKHYRGIELLAAKMQPKRAKAEYDAESFIRELHSFEDDLNEMTSLILQGPPGTGKTQYALAHFNTPLLVSHMDDLREFVGTTHDGIVFDDMDFKHLPRTTQIHLTDCALDRTLHCRYQNACIPRGTKKIFTTNEENTCFDISDGAIKRRCTILRVRAKLF